MKTERNYPKCVITPKGTRWVEQGHPWIYEAEVLALEGECENGGLVDAVSEKGKYLGTGFLSRQSKIRVRLLSHNANDRFDDAFWKRRIQYRDGSGHLLLPDDLWGGGRLPWADGGSVFGDIGDPSLVRRDGAAEGRDFSPAGGGPSGGRPGDSGHL